MSFFCEECGLEWPNRRNQDSVEDDVCHKCIDEYEGPEEDDEGDEPYGSGGYRTWGKEISYEGEPKLTPTRSFDEAPGVYSGSTDTFSVKPYTPPQPKVSVDAEVVDGTLKIHSVDVEWHR